MSPRNSSSDAEIIKTLLAVTSKPHEGGAYSCVAEIRDVRNERPALIAARGQAQIVLVGSMISRLVAQTCRQSGLSVVYEELLDFGGDEIYFAELPSLTGSRYADLHARFRTSAIMGLVQPDGTPLVNPPADTILGAGWKLIAVSEDDDTIIPDEKPAAVDSGNIVTAPGEEKKMPEEFIFVGWNWKLPQILSELDAYVGPRSKVLVLGAHEAAHARFEALAKKLRNIDTLEYRVADITDRAALEALPLSTADHVIAMSNDEDFSVGEADARTLIALLHIRDMARERSLKFSLTSELLDARTQELAKVTEADDFIVSDRLVGLLLVQISENPALNPVFADLFDPEGSELYFKPIEDYVRTGVEMDGYTVFAAAAARGQSALGWRILAAKGADRATFGVDVNPDKARRIRFAPGDKLIVLSEE